MCCEKLGSKIEQFVNQLSQSTLNCIHFHFVTFLFFRTHCKVSLPLCQGTYIGFIANEKITFYCSLTLLTQAALAHRVVQIYSLHLVLITEADISISELHWFSVKLEICEGNDDPGRCKIRIDKNEFGCIFIHKDAHAQFIR